MPNSPLDWVKFLPRHWMGLSDEELDAEIIRCWNSDSMTVLFAQREAYFKAYEEERARYSELKSYFQFGDKILTNEEISYIVNWARNRVEVEDNPCWFDVHGFCQEHLDGTYNEDTRTWSCNTAKLRTIFGLTPKEPEVQ